MSDRVETWDIYVCLTGEIIAGYNVGCTLRLAAGTCALKAPSLSTVMTSLPVLSHWSSPESRMGHTSA